MYTAEDPLDDTSSWFHTDSRLTHIRSTISHACLLGQDIVAILYVHCAYPLADSKQIHGTSMDPDWPTASGSKAK